MIKKMPIKSENKLKQDSLTGVIISASDVERNVSSSTESHPMPNVMTSSMRSQRPLDLLDDPTLRERIVARSSSEGFVACVSYGALAEGHLLIVPLYGARSIAEATRLQRRSDEFWEFFGEIKEKLTSQFKKPILSFEHGMAPFRCGSSCSTEHAHIHVLPFAKSIKEGAFKALAPWIKVHDLNRSREATEAGSDYLTFSDGDASNWFHHQVDRGTAPAAQFFRRLVANASNRPYEWDWSMHPNEKLVQRTLDKLGTINLAKEKISLNRTAFVYSGSRNLWGVE